MHSLTRDLFSSVVDQGIALEDEQDFDDGDQDSGASDALEEVPNKRTFFKRNQGVTKRFICQRP